MANEPGTNADRLIDIASRHDNRGGPERRKRERFPYEANVALLMVAPTGERGQPMIVRAKDISMSGIRVASRHMIYTGSEGVMLLVRSDDRAELVGVRVKHCRYVGSMEHQIGFEFIPVPAGLSKNDFLDGRGRLILADPKARENNAA